MPSAVAQHGWMLKPAAKHLVLLGLMKAGMHAQKGNLAMQISPQLDAVMMRLKTHRLWAAVPPFVAEQRG